MNRLRRQHVNPSRRPKFQRQQGVYRDPLPQILVQSHRTISISETLLPISIECLVILSEAKDLRRILNGPMQPKLLPPEPTAAMKARESSIRKSAAHPALIESTERTRSHPAILGS